MVYSDNNYLFYMGKPLTKAEQQPGFAEFHECHMHIISNDGEKFEASQTVMSAMLENRRIASEVFRVDSKNPVRAGIETVLMDGRYYNYMLAKSFGVDGVSVRYDVQFRTSGLASGMPDTFTLNNSLMHAIVNVFEEIVGKEARLSTKPSDKDEEPHIAMELAANLFGASMKMTRMVDIDRGEKELNRKIGQLEIDLLGFSLARIELYGIRAEIGVLEEERLLKSIVYHKSQLHLDAGQNPISASFFQWAVAMSAYVQGGFLDLALSQVLLFYISHALNKLRTVSESAVGNKEFETIFSVFREVLMKGFFSDDEEFDVEQLFSVMTIPSPHFALSILCPQHAVYAVPRIGRRAVVARLIRKHGAYLAEAKHDCRSIKRQEVFNHELDLESKEMSDPKAILEQYLFRENKVAYKGFSLIERPGDLEKDSVFVDDYLDAMAPEVYLSSMDLDSSLNFAFDFADWNEINKYFLHRRNEKLFPVPYPARGQTSLISYFMTNYYGMLVKTDEKREAVSSPWGRKPVRYEYSALTESNVFSDLVRSYTNKHGMFLSTPILNAIGQLRRGVTMLEVQDFLMQRNPVAKAELVTKITSELVIKIGSDRTFVYDIKQIAKEGMILKKGEPLFSYEHEGKVVEILAPNNGIMRSFKQDGFACCLEPLPTFENAKLELNQEPMRFVFAQIYFCETGMAPLRSTFALVEHDAVADVIFRRATRAGDTKFLRKFRPSEGEHRFAQAPEMNESTDAEDLSFGEEKETRSSTPANLDGPKVKIIQSGVMADRERKERKAPLTKDVTRTSRSYTSHVPLPLPEEMEEFFPRMMKYLMAEGKPQQILVHYPIHMNPVGFINLEGKRSRFASPKAFLRNAIMPTIARQAGKPVTFMNHIYDKVVDNIAEGDLRKIVDGLSFVENPFNLVAAARGSTVKDVMTDVSRKEERTTERKKSNIARKAPKRSRSAPAPDGGRKKAKVWTQKRKTDRNNKEERLR